MKKIIRLTESDLVRLVNKVLNEQGRDQVVSVQRTPQEWFKNFPCLDETIRKRGLVNNSVTVKGDHGRQTSILLPEPASGSDKEYNEAVKDADNRYVGKVRGKGVYYCKTFPNVGRPVLQVMGAR